MRRVLVEDGEAEHGAEQRERQQPDRGRHRAKRVEDNDPQRHRHDLRHHHPIEAVEEIDGVHQPDDAQHQQPSSAQAGIRSGNTRKVSGSAPTTTMPARIWPSRRARHGERACVVDGAEQDQPGRRDQQAEQFRLGPGHPEDEAERASGEHRRHDAKSGALRRGDLVRGAVVGVRQQMAHEDRPQHRDQQRREARASRDHHGGPERRLSLRHAC